jgi:hypothetical protein
MVTKTLKEMIGNINKILVCNCGGQAKRLADLHEETIRYLDYR